MAVSSRQSPAQIHPRQHRRGWVRGAHACALVVAVVGVLAQLLRPLAPELGQLDPVTRWFDAAYLDAAVAYRRPLRAVSAAALCMRVGVPWLMILTPTGRAWVEWLVSKSGGQRSVRAAVAVTVAVTALTDLLLVPVAFWSGYLHEGAWGLRTQGLSGWLFDWTVAHGLRWTAVAVLTAGGVLLARGAPRVWAPLAGLGAAGLAVLLLLTGPMLLEPLRFRTTPLPDGPVREEVQRVLDEAGERIDRLLVADASRRSTRTNAYVSGLGPTRRVVLFDTLVTTRPADEVGLILAHELAHDRHHDLARAGLFGATGLILGAYVLAAVLRRRTHERGGVAFMTGTDACVALAVAVTLLVGSLPVQSLVSRRAEAAADHAALELTDDPVTYERMMVNLTRDNLAQPDPPAWARWLWATHPSARERLTRAARWSGQRDP